MGKLDGLIGSNPSPSRKRQQGFRSPVNVLDALRTVAGIEALLADVNPTKEQADLLRDIESQKPRKTALSAIDAYLDSIK